MYSAKSIALDLPGVIEGINPAFVVRAKSVGYLIGGVAAEFAEDTIDVVPTPCSCLRFDDGVKRRYYLVQRPF